MRGRRARARTRAARLAAPVAFLVAATIAILLVRSGLDNGADGAPATTAPTTTQPGTTAATTTAAGEPEFYVIKSGDTLEVIAEEHETTVEQLLVLNPDLDPVALTVGQRIRVK